MGFARIAENIGEGLYRATLIYDVGPIEDEIAALTEENAKHFQLLYEALKTRDELRVAEADARDGLDAVIEQWIEALLTADEAPPIPEQTDEMIPVEDEQAEALFSAVNAARTDSGVDPLTRVSALDRSVEFLLPVLANTGRTTDINSTPEMRATQAGYLYDEDAGVGRCLGFGWQDAEECVERWMRGANADTLTSDQYTECGVAFFYAANRNPYTYFWGLVLAAPGTATSTERPAEEGAKKAEEEEAQLERITPPSVDTMQPTQLGEAAGRYAIAVRQRIIAEDEVAKLQADKVERDRRLGTLQELMAGKDTPIAMWACQYTEDLQPGDTVSTAEVPGYNRALYRNIIPQTTSGMLRHAEAMNAELVFFLAAMEPGHLKWMPMWRYGVITATQGQTCDIDLLDTGLRRLSASENIDLDAEYSLDAVAIDHPCQDLFEVDDVVLIQYQGHQRDDPRVIGWREEPRECEGGRTWVQLR